MKHVIRTGTTPEDVVVVDTLQDVITHLAPDFGPTETSTRRSVDEQEVTEAFKALPEAKRRVRVYSAAGFVPNAYRYRCDIQWVEANLDDQGQWHWSLDWGRAQRSNARANRVVVQ